MSVKNVLSNRSVKIDENGKITVSLEAKDELDKDSFLKRVNMLNQNKAQIEANLDQFKTELDKAKVLENDPELAELAKKMENEKFAQGVGSLLNKKAMQNQARMIEKQLELIERELNDYQEVLKKISKGIEIK